MSQLVNPISLQSSWKRHATPGFGQIKRRHQKKDQQIESKPVAARALFLTHELKQKPKVFFLRVAF